MTSKQTTNKRLRRRALTLTELVVALICLALLAPLLAARGASVTRPNRERMCAYRLGRLGSAMLQYTIENGAHLPGSPGTSGAQMIYEYGNVPADSIDIPLALTQTWDWAAPLTTYLDITLDPNRARRFEQFREGHFWCPANDLPSHPWYQGNIGPFDEWNTIRMLSFVTIRNFLIFEDTSSLDPQIAPHARRAQLGGTVRFPADYVPRLDHLGTVPNKVFLADGSRFLNPSGLVDHDINNITSTGGAYSDGGPTLPDVFLRSFFLNSPYKEYAYRHSHAETAGINAAHYDGHVAWMSEPASRHPRWWYPTGTRIPWVEMNDPTRMPLFEEIAGDPNFEYHVP